MQIISDMLQPNEYSRPGLPLKTVKKIVVHYVGNPMSTAKNNRDYFNNMPKFPEKSRRYVSSHFVVGLEGEVIQCIPNEEISYGASAANAYSINIECCHPDAAGKFNEKTTKSLVELLALLCTQFKLEPMTDVIRHYDATGKECPIWYVKNPADWQVLRQSVSALISLVPAPIVPSAPVPKSDMTIKEAAEKLKKLGIPTDLLALEAFLSVK